MTSNFEYNLEAPQSKTIDQKDISTKKEIVKLEDLDGFLNGILIITNEEQDEILKNFRIAENEQNKEKKQELILLAYELKDKQDEFFASKIKEDPNFFIQIKKLLQKNSSHARILIETMDKVKGLKANINNVNNNYNLI